MAPVVTWSIHLLVNPCKEYASIVIGMSVYFCLSVLEDISGTTRVIFARFSLHVAYDRGSIFLLWRGQRLLSMIALLMLQGRTFSQNEILADLYDGQNTSVCSANWQFSSSDSKCHQQSISLRRLLIARLVRIALNGVRQHIVLAFQLE